ncbi:MAG: hypothetical protein ABI910_22215 [Gemmatimonadota bacterium]
MLSLSVAACGAPPPPPPAHDPALRSLPMWFYPAADTTIPPRAVVFFFGNDVGFWEPHQELAWALSGQQIAVAGLDMRQLLRQLPEDEVTRERAFVDEILLLIARSRHELHGDSIPLIIAGHSLGAEVAVWTAAFAHPPGTIGVLALSPGSRSHLRVSLGDLAMSAEPVGAGSFSVAAAVAHLPSGERLAIVRGERDKFSFADSCLLAAGGARAHRYLVRFGNHSLREILIARPTVRRAVDWVLERRPPISGSTTATGSKESTTSRSVARWDRTQR